MKDRGRARESFRRLRPNAQISRGFSQGGDIKVMRLKGVQQCRDHSLGCSEIDERVAPFVVTEPSIHAVRLRVEHENLILGWIGKLQGARQAKLERHVEPRRSADSAHVMKGDAAGAHQIVDALKPSLATLAHLEHAVRRVIEEDDETN